MTNYLYSPTSTSQPLTDRPFRSHRLLPCSACKGERLKHMHGCRDAAIRSLRALVLENHTDFRAFYGRRKRCAACSRNIARTLESLSSSTAPWRTLHFIINFVARAPLFARGSLSSSRAAWRALRLVSNFEAMVILAKRRASLRV